MRRYCHKCARINYICTLAVSYTHLDLAHIPALAIKDDQKIGRQEDREQNCGSNRFDRRIDSFTFQIFDVAVAKGDDPRQRLIDSVIFGIELLLCITCLLYTSQIPAPMMKTKIPARLSLHRP